MKRLVINRERARALKRTIGPKYNRCDVITTTHVIRRYDVLYTALKVCALYYIYAERRLPKSVPR